MKKSQVMAIYFTLGGFGFSCLFASIFSVRTCIYPGWHREDPSSWCAFAVHGSWLHAGFVLSIIAAMALLVATHGKTRE